VLAACEQAGIPFIAYVPLGTGRLLERDQSLHQVAARHAATPAQVALAWLLAQSEVVLPLPGTTSLAHLEQNMRAVELRLSDEDFAALGRRP
jgi:aryl-alcohol dehydrogenase-like predicted oxidoreductase